MGKVYTKPGGGSSDLSFVTAAAGDIVSGKVGANADGEPVNGSLSLSGNAATSDVASGKTFYTTNPKSKQTGTLVDRGQYQMAGGWGSGGSGSDAYFAMNAIPEGIYRSNGANWAPEIRMKQTDLRKAIGYTDASKVWNGVTIAGLKGTLSVSSVVSFSKASVSGLSVTLKWKNPSKGPYGGVIIRYKTGSYPTSVSDGTQFYKGTGTNSALNGESTCTAKVPNANTTYYFRIWMYCDTSNGTMYSSSKDLTVSVPKISGNQTFTGSGTFTVPDGVTKIKVFIVGGGGGGQCGTGRNDRFDEGGTGGGGGGGGYTNTAEYTVSSGQKCTVTIGAGGAAFNDKSEGDTSDQTRKAGATSFRLPNGTTLTAQGGFNPHRTSMSIRGDGANGGSGGGGGNFGQNENVDLTGGAGGSNGGNGAAGGNGGSQQAKGGSGQGKTTRAYGESNGTLYAGGGGGGGCPKQAGTASGSPGGNGGSGGGGRGAASPYGQSAYNAGAGTANTGGGGGGGRGVEGSANKGASGICLIKWGY